MLCKHKTTPFQRQTAVTNFKQQKFNLIVENSKVFLEHIKCKNY